VTSIDVIIPAYNAERTIEACVKSVIAQTLQPRKIIVVDDGSTDRTIEVLGSIDCPYLRIIRTSHGGVSRARNLGVGVTDSDFVAFLDSDDAWNEEKLQRQVDALTIDSDAAVAYCGIIHMDEAGNDIAGTTSIPFFKGNVFLDLLHYAKPLYGSASGVIVRRSALIETGGFDEEMAFSEDIDLWVRLAERYTYTYTTYVGVRIRISSTSATRRHDPHRDILLHVQHFRFLGKWSRQYPLPWRRRHVELKKIVLLAVKQQWGMTDLAAFHKLISAQAPGYLKYVGRSIPMFYARVSMAIAIGSLELLWRRINTIRPIDRLHLLISEGHLRFRNSRNFEKWKR
jgi:glycosyltransferase involved in cell wall biosynthesis